MVWPGRWGSLARLSAMPGTPALRFYLRSNLLKYLPGGIWHLADQVQRVRLERASQGQ